MRPTNTATADDEAVQADHQPVQGGARSERHDGQMWSARWADVVGTAARSGRQGGVDRQRPWWRPGPPPQPTHTSPTCSGPLGPITSTRPGRTCGAAPTYPGQARPVVLPGRSYPPATYRSGRGRPPKPDRPARPRGAFRAWVVTPPAVVRGEGRPARRRAALPPSPPGERHRRNDFSRPVGPGTTRRFDGVLRRA